MPAASMALLGRRLRQAGFDTRAFGYACVARDATANARRLAAFALEAAGDAPRLHLVGHSTGGVLLLRALADSAALSARTARAVLLGSPYADSAAAHAFARLPGGRRLLGRTLPEWLSTPRPVPRNEVGVVAGTRAVGVSRLVVRHPGPSDGAVSVAEAQVPGARDSIVLPVAHAELVLSARVAAEVAAFLRDGRFSAGAPRA